jgi:hypothetical protein
LSGTSQPPPAEDLFGPIPRNFRLSPSDFAFLWEECPRCFYLKIAAGFRRPPGPFPRIFGTIDGAMKDCFMKKRTEEIVAALPPGVVAYDEEWVESVPIDVPGSESTCFIRGKFDTILHFDDDTYGVIDFKTTRANPKHLAKYSRQLHAYAYALENPAPEKFGVSPVTKLGLLVYEPWCFSHEFDADAALTGRLEWVEIPRNDDSFSSYLKEVVDLLDRPEAPAPAKSCAWCKYRDASRESGL